MQDKRDEIKKSLTASNLIHVNLNAEENKKQDMIDQQPVQKESGEFEEVKLSFKNQSILCSHLDNILADNVGKNSVEWKSLCDAATKAMEVIADKKRLNSDEGVLRLLELSEASNHYYETHLTKGGKIAERRKTTARAVRNILCKNFAKTAGIEDEELLPVEELNEREKGANENVKRFSEYYVSFSKKVGEDIVGSSEEKLRRRWNVLKSCEKDIRIFKQIHEGERKIDPDITHVLNEYDNIRSQILFLDKLKKTGGHKAVFENKIVDDLRQKTYATEDKPLPAETLVTKDKGNEGLSDKQLAGLSEIDTWVMRNFNNGGYMACVGGTTDRFDIVNNLLSLSKRERLFVYYLVEKHERLSPSIEGFGESQTDYEPDVSAFKKHMISNKLKFYSRFSGGYIYWNKLNQAMAIASRTRPLLQAAMKNKNGASKIAKVTGKKKQLSETQKKQKDHLGKLFELLKNGKKVLEKFNKEKNRNMRLKLKAELDSLRELAEIELTSLQELDDKIEKQNLKQIRESLEGAGAKKASRKADVKQYISGMPGDIGGLALKSTNLVKENVLGFSEARVKSILSVMNPANATLGAINSVIGFVFGAMALADGIKNMSWLETGESSLGLVTSGATAVSKGAGFVKLFTGKDNALTAKSFANGLIVADLGLQAAHLATMTRDEYHRMKAVEKLGKVLDAKKKKGESIEFEKNMYYLQDKIASSRAKTTFTKLALSGAMVTTLFVCPPVGAVISAIVFVGGIVNRVVENRRKRANKYYLFDNHFGIEKQANLLIEKKQVREPVDKEKLMDQLRRRVAASIGFVSPSDAADAFAKRYAQKMIELANAGTANSDFYIQLIKGFGLYYRYKGPGDKKNRPSVADLAKKLAF